jgi:acylaminoacyl-peptidase
MLDINSGFINPITEGKLSHSLADFDNEAGTILVTRNPSDYAKPPHMLTELVEVNLKDNQQTVLGQYRTFSSAKYADDGIYVVAGPDFANGLGRAIPENMLANNYDGQLYKLDRQGQNAKALSKSFDPAIGSMQVLSNDDVVMKVTERDTQQLYLYDESKARFTKLKTGFDVVGKFSISDERNPDLLVTGTQASHPQQLKRLDISKNRAKTLWDSKALAYENSEIATLSEFNFTNKEGVEIKGRVYTPHNLDESKQYPALVYYYGGTSPVSRGFTGRYPFNLWAAQGYVVYVLQPTGATGFGQEFSAKHVNAWGEYTANDIIEGTKKFLAAHPYVNKDKVGNLGASYGGFMTMLLATKTDLFSASISHAGISNITSYWGQGWWGYLYSGEASKNSFPWNNPKLYSDHSPVFHADKVNSPLLLIHGDADTNVPPGESHNMYTALKLLGKDVELIEYKGTDHQVFARDRRFHWWDTMLAYFDMHLKDQPQWWQYIYK